MGNAAQTLEASNKRLQERTPVQVEIDIFSDHNFWSGLTMNMSEGGVFIATHKVVPPGTMLVLEMAIPGEEKPICALAEVRWTRPFSTDAEVPPGLGLRFVSLDEESLGKIRRFVERVREPLFYDD